MLNKMKTLITQLLKANAAYYGEDNPIMTDLEYDRLYGELEQLEKETGIVLASSPTQRVSGKVLESLTTVTHTKPMLSANKTKSTVEIFKFIGGRKWSSAGSWTVSHWCCAMRVANWSRPSPAATVSKVRMLLIPFRSWEMCR